MSIQQIFQNPGRKVLAISALTANSRASHVEALFMFEQQRRVHGRTKNGMS